MGSQQYVEEWEVYKNILQACRVTEKTVWLDIRGNHGMSHIQLQSIPNYLYTLSEKNLLFLFHYTSVLMFINHCS